MGHLGGWVEVWRAHRPGAGGRAKSPAFDRLTEIGRDWDAQGDAINARLQAEWAALSMGRGPGIVSRTLPGEPARLPDGGARGPLAQGFGPP